MATRTGLVALVLLPLAADGSLGAQTLVGRTVEQGSGLGVPGAAVSLLTPSGAVAAEALSDSAGWYRLPPPAPGEFIIEVRGFGYELFRSPLLALAAKDVEAGLDLELVPEPIGLEGLAVTADAQAEELLGVFGITPTDLGRRFVTREELDRMPNPEGPREALRWRAIPGVSILEDGASGGAGQLCVTFSRVGRCALLILNGAEITPHQAQAISPSELEGMAVLRPVEATTFFGTRAGAGVVIMWTRRGGLTPR